MQFDEFFFDHFFFDKRLKKLACNHFKAKFSATLMDNRVVGIYFGKQNQSFKPKLGNLGLKFHQKKWMKKIRQTAASILVDFNLEHLHR